MVLGTASKKSHPGRKAAHKHLRPSGIVLANGLGFGSNKTSSSHSVGHSFISTNSFGHRTLRQEVLHATAIQVRQNHDQVEYQHHHNSIPIDEHQRLADIRADEVDNFPEQEAQINIHNILTGDVAADISHAGSEFSDLLAIEDGLLGPISQ
jgi:hypothetical protein